MAGSAYETVANAIITTFNAEFAAEGFVMIRDRLHPALGRDSVAVGVSPEEDSPNVRNMLVQETVCTVQFFGYWDDSVDPGTVVDPATVTSYAERFRAALKRTSAIDPNTRQAWYFNVERVQYPDDPTGNKTRFVATVRAYGENAALVETTV